MDFWKKNFSIFWKNDRVWTDLADQNQKNGDISAPDGQNFNRFFLSDSTSKNTSKKFGEKKFDPRPRTLMSKYWVSQYALFWKTHKR